MFKVEFMVEDKKLPGVLRSIAAIGGVTEVISVPVLIDDEPHPSQVKKLTKATRAAGTRQETFFQQIVKHLGKRKFTRIEIANAAEALGRNKMAGYNALFKASQQKLVAQDGEIGNWKLIAKTRKVKAA